jgi:hypothetical protein
MSELLLQARRLAAVEVVSAAPVRRALLLALFALLTALGAYVAVPLPVGPVPLSLQTLFVLLCGLLLGPRLGAAAQAAYLTAGFVGLPVFAQGFGGPGVLLGPTGGYLIAFPAAAALARLGGGTGAAAGRQRGRRGPGRRRAARQCHYPAGRLGAALGHHRQSRARRGRRSAAVRGW